MNAVDADKWRQLATALISGMIGICITLLGLLLAENRDIKASLQAIALEMSRISGKVEGRSDERTSGIHANGLDRSRTRFGDDRRRSGHALGNGAGFEPREGERMRTVLICLMLSGCSTTFTGICALKAMATHGDMHYFATHCQASETK